VQVGASDVTGAGMLVAGVVLLVLGAEMLLRGRRSTRGRWLTLLKHGGVLGAAATAVVVVLVPIFVGTAQVNLPRRGVSPAPSQDFESARLLSADGVRLAAWYRPSTNGAAVVLISSARGDHSTVGEHARMLAGHGYGVLVFDARGSGGSQGAPNGWGWSWLPDVEAAIDFVLSQPEVDRGVALLGLSTGADVALQVTARDSRVRGLVADGATAQGFSDRPPGALNAVASWPMYATAHILTGVPELRPLVTAAAALDSRPAMLVAAGSIPEEIPFNERYARAAGPSVSLWTLPTTGHTRAIHDHRAEYEQRVLRVFEQALGTGLVTGVKR
jgi:pimeloyl-ACP methyl ester carboxylesterase